MSLLDEIERDALDDHVSVATSLWKCVALGGRSGSAAMRDWATRELDGYEGGEELPDYRIVVAPLQLDGMNMSGMIRGQAVPPSALPDFVGADIREEVQLRFGIAQIEDLARQSEIKLGLPMGGDLVRLMNAENEQRGTRGQHIDRIYWAVSPTAFRGVVSHVRTSLVKLIAELRATTPEGHAAPSQDAADQAINFVISGKRAKVNVNAAQAFGTATTATVNGAAPTEPPTWTAWRTVGAVVVGLATIAAAVFAAIQVF